MEELKKELEKAQGGSLKPASKDELELAVRAGFPTVLIDFYREYAPDPKNSCIQLEQRIWSVKCALEENKDYLPGAYLFRLGYVVFASNKSGDAYCLDTVHVSSDGRFPIALFPHEVIEEGASLEDVEPYRLTVAEDLEDFIRRFASRSLIQKPKY